LLLADPDMRSLVAEKVIHVDPCPTFQYSRTLSPALGRGQAI
jgi:hypothetical protein